MTKQIMILGGDARSHYLAEALRKDTDKCSGTKVIELGNPLAKESMSQAKLLAELERSDIIALPIPYSIDGVHLKWGAAKETPPLLSVLQESFHEGQTVFGGVLKPDLIRQLHEKEITAYDFMKIKGVAELNAVATAEGAIAEAVLAMPGNLENSKCLVLGYGICGKVIAKKLKLLSEEVTVMARREEVRREAVQMGMKVLPMFCELNELPDHYRLVINTIPSMVLDRKALGMLSEDAVIIDIASNPGGTDFKAAGEMGIAAKLCLGIPGKYAPKRSGEILAEIMIREVGETNRD